MSQSELSSEMPNVGPLVQQLLHYAPDAIIAVTDTYKIVFANSQAEQLFGFSTEELVGQSLDLIIPKRFHEAHRQHEKTYLENPTTRPMGRDLDLVACRKNKSEFPIDISLSPLQTENGFLICAAIRDMTDKRQSEQKIRRYATELERSNAELVSFAHIAAHDLRGPLRRVKTICELIQSDFSEDLGGRADELFEMLDVSVKQMQALISDLLEHSKVGSDQKPLGPVDTSKIVQKVLLDLRNEIDEKNVTVNCNSLPTVHGESIQLSRLFHNLLGNSITYRSNSPLNIDIDAAKTDDLWEFRVCDNGIGIDPKNHEKIFEIFQRLHSEQEFPGTGIGLATCRKIVELHGGQIWVESQPGNGSTFCFTIPNASKP